MKRAPYACNPWCDQCALIGWPLEPGQWTDAEQLAYLHLQESVRGRR